MHFTTSMTNKNQSGKNDDDFWTLIMWLKDLRVRLSVWTFDLWPFFVDSMHFTCVPFAQSSCNVVVLFPISLVLFFLVFCFDIRHTSQPRKPIPFLTQKRKADSYTCMTINIIICVHYINSYRLITVAKTVPDRPSFSDAHDKCTGAHDLWHI